MLVRAKETGDEPEADAVTVYDPSTSLGAAVTAAWPPAMTAEVADKRSPRHHSPRDSATNVTTPPSTGSTGLLAVTATASGSAKAVPMAAVCGVLPATAVSVKPWLSKAPMSTAADARLAALVGGGAPAGGAGVDRRAAGQQGDRFGRTAIVAQGPQPRVAHADEVAVDPVDQPARAAGADQVKRARNGADDVAMAAVDVGIAGDDRVGQRGRAAVELSMPPPGYRGGVAPRSSSWSPSACRY